MLTWYDITSLLIMETIAPLHVALSSVCLSPLTVQRLRSSPLTLYTHTHLLAPCKAKLLMAWEEAFWTSRSEVTRRWINGSKTASETGSFTMEKRRGSVRRWKEVCVRDGRREVDGCVG